MHYFLPLLTVVFLVLKLTGYIDWHWFWVFSPLVAAVLLAVLLIILLPQIAAWWVKRVDKMDL
jgi:uncharacterized membrane protein YoaK (UPF0700 family)